MEHIVSQDRRPARWPRQCSSSRSRETRASCTAAQRTTSSPASSTSTATPEEKRAAVAACFAVAATDHEITAEEYAELTEIAEELGLTRAELNVIRTSTATS